MRWLLYAYSLTRNILLFAVAIALVHTFVGSLFLVAGLSMSPTLASGEVLFVNKLAYLTQKPDRGDIVILKYPGDPDRRKFVKRIISLPGETVSIQAGNVLIDGKRLTEAYLDIELRTEPQLAVKLKSDEYFTMGDNRPNSSDSRVFGAAPKRFLIGRAKLRLWPIAEFGYIPEVFY